MPQKNEHDFDNILLFKGKPRSFFQSIGLKLTGKCRLQCPFCCEPDRKQEEYPLENFKKIADLLKKLGTERLCLTGGDPLLYQDLLPLIKYTNDLGFYNLLLTSDGNLLKSKYKEIIPYVKAIRFSIHATQDSHDELVSASDAFSSIEEMLSVLRSAGVNVHVTTVVSQKNKGAIFEIAKWCHLNGVTHYYLFGLMRSGKGSGYIDDVGKMQKEEVEDIIHKLQATYPEDQMKVTFYDYEKNAECILVYGDGRVVIDPYPNPPNYQADIGNLFFDSEEKILKTFCEDPENVAGYTAHLEVKNDML